MVMVEGRRKKSPVQRVTTHLQQDLLAYMERKRKKDLFLYKVDKSTYLLRDWDKNREGVVFKSYRNHRQVYTMYITPHANRK